MFLTSSNNVVPIENILQDGQKNLICFSLDSSTIQIYIVFKLSKIKMYLSDMPGFSL